uniref:Probable methyltransferase BMT2 homolog n=1 Tax=Trypanosoma congolense (strain IL3000) TaxID=1068625 RepID=G0URQ6_TRYCI|nr:conserved hypothetical protein [Trypanosoma congolense IL3000]
MSGSGDQADNVSPSGEVAPTASGDYLNSQQQMSSVIKSFHHRLQQRMAATSSAGLSSESEEDRWFRLIAEEKEQLALYATAMHGIATRFWKPDKGKSKGGACEGDITDLSIAVTAASDDVESHITKRPRDVGEDEDELHGKEELISGFVQHDDRIRYTLRCVGEYFLGVCRMPPMEHVQQTGNCTSNGVTEETAPAARGVVCYEKLPLMISSLAKIWRKDFYSAHGRQAAAGEVETEVFRVLGLTKGLLADDHNALECPLLPEKKLLKEEPVKELVARCMARTHKEIFRRCLRNHPHSKTAFRDSSTTLRVLDVGSCYGPFSGRSVTNGIVSIPLEVTALDLSPYEGSNVIKADWLAVQFHNAAEVCDSHGSRATATAIGERKEACDSVVGSSSCADVPIVRINKACGEEHVSIARGAFDAVFFCLMLSFLPHPSLRYRACLHAYLALKDGGLLVVVSTRTQGARRSRWVEDWVACIEGIGFKRVHKNIMKQLVGLSFSKLPAGSTGIPCGPDGDAGSWIKRMMSCAGAVNRLRTIADEPHSEIGEAEGPY